MDFAGCPSDVSFGPAVRDCRDGFDFTLKFELLFFSLIPSAIFTGLCLPRLVWLIQRPVVVARSWSWFVTAKLAAIVCYAGLRLALLVLTTKHSASFRQANLFIPSEALELAAALSMVIISRHEHSRSRRPSILLSAYLSLTILFDVAHDRTLWLSKSSPVDFAFARIFTTAVAMKVIILVLESRQKSKWIIFDEPAAKHTPEETTNIYSLSTFMWLNSIFASGYKKILDQDDLHPVDQHMVAQRLQSTFVRHANIDLHGQKHGLVLVLVKTLLVPLLLPIAPRIALIGFSFSQAFLIESVLVYLGAEQEKSRNIGYGLIGATILIYSGIALSTSLYWYFQERVMYMVRACLVSAIYRKTTEAEVEATGRSDAVTLMSTDIDRILKGLQNVHELWANIVSVALASWLLELQIGVAFVSPIGLVAISAISITVLGRYIGGQQRAWMKAIQKRVSLTANVIACMKHLQIAGLASPVEESIHGLRLHELRVSQNFRRLQILGLAIAFFPNIIAPPITLAATSALLDESTIFTSIAFLTLLTIPLGDLFRSVTPLMSALACLGRIQAYLENAPRADFRDIVQSRNQGPSMETKNSLETSYSERAVRVINGHFGWKENEYCLRNIDINIPRYCLTMVVGPVASGKSSFCKALLGEIPYSKGRTIIECSAGRVGFCDQTPFLSNKTIKENIVGFSHYNAKRYSEVIDAALLSHDLSLLPRGDETPVGSNGIALSGGQKQRVALARALYVECELLIFDDVLSGLDVDTEEQVFIRVFGPNGLLKKRCSTAVLCTHSVRHLPSSDHIIALTSDGSIAEEGAWDTLATNGSYVQMLGVEPVDQSRSISQLQSNKTGAVNKVDIVQKTAAAVQRGATDLARKNGDIRVYKHYFQHIPPLALFTFLFSVVVYGFGYNFTTIWIKYWSSDVTSPTPSHTKGYWVGLYTVFEMLALFGSVGAIYLGMSYMAITSGAALHLSALKTVTRAPLSFFSLTDLGAITNHFSQDLTLIDGELPASIINFSTDMAITVGMAGVLGATTPYLCISYPFVLAILYVLQKIYLSTSRQMRLLDLEAKTPLYAHFLDSSRGIATIRAFGWIEANIAQNHEMLDISQRPAYLLALIQRWLLFVLNMFVLGLAVLAVTLVTQLRGINTGFTGSGLLTLMQLGTFLATDVQCYAKLETSIGAVSRLKAFTEDTVSHSMDAGDVAELPSSWPSRGSVEVNGVSASYETGNGDSPRSLVLRDVTFVIHPGQKVAICGRTGSGKSSLLLLLLRLLDPVPSTSQNIIIDGVHLQKIDRATLRQRIIAVPQETIFLPAGSAVRENLDPFGRCTETQYRSVLECVGLWRLVEASGGLGAVLNTDTLSLGQKQLFSLARAVLRMLARSRLGALLEAQEAGADWGLELGAVPTSQETAASPGSGGILLLDEISSGVDVETERVMFDVIGRSFANYTIIMISHKLDVVVERFDRVIVLDGGAVQEDGNPRELLKRQGDFSKLWAASGKGKEKTRDM